MKLADRITITLAGEEVELHPALRHAIRLERRDGSFRKLLADISDGSLTAAVEIIRDHYSDATFINNRVFDAGVDNLAPSLTRYVIACTGLDPYDDEQPKRGKPSQAPVAMQSFEERLRELYRWGTGWLGWTPVNTLDATPTEIMEAYRGKLDMLKAVYGGGETEKPVDDRPLADKFRSVFGSIGTTKAQEA
jgi:hypothetical protein